MGTTYFADVAYGFVIKEEDSDVLALMAPLMSNDVQDGVIFDSLDIDWKRFSKAWPDLEVSSSGYDGDNVSIIIYVKDTRYDLSSEGRMGAWSLASKGGDENTDSQLEAFSEMYGIFAKPSWVAWSSAD